MGALYKCNLNGHHASSLAGRLCVGPSARSGKADDLTSSSAYSLSRLGLACQFLALSALPFLLSPNQGFQHHPSSPGTELPALSSCPVSSIRSLVWRNGQRRLSTASFLPSYHPHRSLFPHLALLPASSAPKLFATSRNPIVIHFGPLPTFNQYSGD